MPQPQAGEAVDQLMLELLCTYFRLQTEADRLVGQGGFSAGKLGILRTLHDEGLRTVPQIARSRPGARQGVQRNADGLAEQGLIEYVDNPHHRRSRLLRLTARGERLYGQMRDQQLTWAALIDDGRMSLRSVRSAIQVLRWLRERLEILSRTAG